MSMIKKISTLPTRSPALAWAEFIELTGIAPDRLRELVSLGWIDVGGTEPECCVFRDADIYRVRKLERICCDFELPVVGGTIIVDLLERIDALERQVRALQGFEE